MNQGIKLLVKQISSSAVYYQGCGSGDRRHSWKNENKLELIQDMIRDVGEEQARGPLKVELNQLYMSADGPTHI